MVTCVLSILLIGLLTAFDLHPECNVLSSLSLFREDIFCIQDFSLSPSRMHNEFKLSLWRKAYLSVTILKTMDFEILCDV